VRSARVVLALLACVAGRSAGQASAGTTVTVHGFFERGDSGGWLLVLPDPVVVGGFRANALKARGDDAPWHRLEHSFVRAQGRVALPEPLIVIERMEEVEPPNIGRAEVHLSFSQTAVVTLAAIPNRFAWRLQDGQRSGVQPLLVYTILNHGQTELDFMLPTNDLLCARVRHAAEREWWSTSVPGRTHNHERIVIRFGGLYRQFVPIPPEAAPRPGRYIAHVTLCGIADYGVETQFDVGTP